MWGKMENNQKINCTVYSCRYNDNAKKKCILESIQITPTDNVKTMKSDESMCSSYQYEN